MLQAAKFQRLYILLRPCAQGGGGYARVEQARGKYTLTVNAHGFSPSEEGIRVLLAARDEGGGAAVCDLGSLPVSDKGQSSLKRDVAATPGGLPLASYSALCIAKEWPNPKLLLMGPLEENSSLSSYLIGETVCRYLSVPTNKISESVLSEEKPAPPALSPAPASGSRPAALPKKADAAPAAVAAPLQISISPVAISAPSEPYAAKPPASPAAPIKTDMLPDTALKESVPFPLPRAVPAPKPASEPAVPRPAATRPISEPPAENPELAVFTSAMERAVFPPDVPAAGPLSGRPPVNALPRLHWPAAVKELENYFSTYPPFAPFDAPGWRFVQVPMAAGSTIPFYAVGMLARDGNVTQVAYAVPGERGALPPPGFSGYRWQQGRNGQGYWTLWKRA